MSTRTPVSHNPVTDRSTISQARRIVIKIGSSSLTTPSGVSLEAIDRLTALIASLRKAGTQVVLVSSGAIAAGLPVLDFDKRPKDLATLQATAAVGQSQLIAYYAQSCHRHGYTVAQVLLTADELMRRTQYNNAFRSLQRLLHLGVIPVVNENDAVATQEIRFGDNDRLAALVANVVKADLLVLLTDVDALYDGPPTRPGSTRIARVRSAEDLHDVTIGTTGPAGVGTGGMVTKVEAASIATGSGIPALLTAASLAAPALDGEDVGTWFDVRGERKTARSAWLGLMAETRGSILIDDGAVIAVTQRHRSLLPAGVVGVRGEFEPGDAVEICDVHGTIVARGLINYSSHELPEMLGKSTAELREALGPEYDRAVVHIDDTVTRDSFGLTTRP
ncbi:glutamate 5-kinase [Auritidibacter ignavus]|uniref:glutamate 5-kinase n=1 Tax=Auritidibacter ignavus TaxID=678932 RepID=UPI00244C312F|nr:glutamate 5-kinase [Auritidibacter ignavus]WGH84209.1 glutamate 5-kinase [Auritidibacter ignavus]